MGKYFNISSPGAFYWLRKFGFRYKKSLQILGSKPREARFTQKAIKEIPPHRLVYVDESGIDTTICKDRGWGKRSSLVKRAVNITRERILLLGMLIINR